MQSPNFGALLRKQWDELYTSKDAKLIMRGNIQGCKYRKMNDYFAVFNASYGNYRQYTIANKQKSVFIAFDSEKFNFTKVSNRQILFHINLDQEEIITRENAHKITEKFFEEDEEEAEIQGHAHPVLMQVVPACRYHCLLSMYPEEELPQVVGSDIILLLLNIFKLLPGIRIGYNSIGGSASINHLHFHMLYPENLIGQPHLPIEKVKPTPWIQSSLINPQQQINLYSVGINIGIISNQNIYCFVISPLKVKDQQIDSSQAGNSLAFGFGILVNELIELSVPHNILIGDDGMTIYVFARDFSNGNQSWMEMSGVMVVLDEKEYQSANDQTLNNKTKPLIIDAKTIDLVKGNVKKNLSKFI